MILAVQQHLINWRFISINQHQSVAVVTRLDQPACRLMAIREHAFELAPDQPAAKPSANDAKRGLILHLVAQNRAAFAIIKKPVAVIPPGKRAGHLSICKKMRRIIFGMDCDPLNLEGTNPTTQHDSASLM